MNHASELDKNIIFIFTQTFARSQAFFYRKNMYNCILKTLRIFLSDIHDFLITHFFYSMIPIFRNVWKIQRKTWKCKIELCEMHIWGLCANLSNVKCKHQQSCARAFWIWQTRQFQLAISVAPNASAILNWFFPQACS